MPNSIYVRAFCVAHVENFLKGPVYEKKNASQVLLPLIEQMSEGVVNSKCGITFLLISRVLLMQCGGRAQYISCTKQVIDYK